MKVEEREFIREAISSDFKHISNPRFTDDTLNKIAELEKAKTSSYYAGDMFFIIPVIIYVSAFFLLSIITVFISWIQLKEVDTVLQSIEIILAYLMHPVTFSILISFLLLYFFDLFLKKLSTRISNAGAV